MQFSLKKLIILIIFNTILLALLYLIEIFPLKEKHHYQKGMISIYPYSEKISISELEKPFIKVINNIDFKNNQYILFDDKALLLIDRNDFRLRGGGKLSIHGEYKTDNDLEKFLDELEVLDEKEVLLKKRRLYIDSYKNDTCVLQLASNNRIEIDFLSTLPYKLSSNEMHDNEYSEFQMYFLEKNYENHLKITKLLQKKYTRIFIIWVVINISVLILSYSIKKFQK